MMKMVNGKNNEDENHNKQIYVEISDCVQMKKIMEKLLLIHKSEIMVKPLIIDQLLKEIIEEVNADRM